jgi:hypothetical protein
MSVRNSTGFSLSTSSIERYVSIALLIKVREHSRRPMAFSKSFDACDLKNAIIVLPVP